MKLSRLRSITLPTLLALSALGTSAPVSADTSFEPPQDEYDWVQLISQEWLKGELISLYDDKLTFDSDILGILELDWEDVEIFRGHGNHRISLEGLSTATGTLRIEGDVVILETEAKVMEAERENIVAITPPAERELDNWSVDVMFGFSTRQGNTETTEYNLAANIERRTPVARVTMDYLGNYNRTEGEEVANNHRVNAAWDKFRGGAFFWRPLFGQYLSDVIQNIDHQITVETGLGYRLIETQRTDWEVSGGIGFNTLRYRSVSEGEDRTNTSPALSISTRLDTEVTSWMDYLLHYTGTFLDEDSGRYQHHVLTTLSTDLVRDWDLDVSFVWDRVQSPQERADGTVPDRDDYRLMVALGYEF